MKENKIALNPAGITPEKAQYGCLAALGLMELALVAFGPVLNYLPYFVVEQLSVIPGLIFLGAVFAAKRSPFANRSLLAGIAAAAWILIAQVLQYVGGEMPDKIGIHWAAYLMAFPFAAMEKEREKGLKLLAAVAVAIGSVMTLYAVLLSVDMLPGWLQGTVYWFSGVRLTVFSSCGTDGCYFMIGMAFALWLFFGTKTQWKKGLFLAAAAAQFIALILTNTRTTIFTTCAIIAGFVFFRIAKGGWKRFLAGLLAAVVVLSSLFFLSEAIFGLRKTAVQNAKAQQTAEETVAMEADAAKPAAEQPAEKPGRSLANHIGTLNGRTTIWQSTLRAVRWNPKVFLRGTPYVGTVISAVDGAITAEHTHNSWLQMLVAFGFPGLLIGLYFTFLAVRGAVYLLLRADTDMSRRCVAMLVLCLLMAGFMETFLFTSYVFYHFINITFFLCTGYVDRWREEIKHPERV